MTPLTDFPFLDTIELIDNDNFGSQVAASYIGQASEVLKQNKSQAEKTVLLTKWTDTWHCGPYENDKAFVTRQVIKLYLELHLENNSTFQLSKAYEPRPWAILELHHISNAVKLWTHSSISRADSILWLKIRSIDAAESA
ncbi:hypothetical protein L210DRAFT_3513311 [Boletus edulis BED1]|uniref:Uncharacterized protein n=1 Tax=Boletus edulis BED1 TaxID=1328754 RepID=A0AAD4B9R4_BOLED|nr:hypothetical protein L210DRAFT_3513311 [Boletus edulis BED1]